MPFTKAKRTNAKLRLAITGSAGSGKTFGALLIALGMEGKIAVIDTENGSADLYAHLGDYDTCQLTPPFDPRRYIQLIHEAENEGYNVIIIDSLSHAWAGEGGVLDVHNNISKNSRNSFGAWRDITPLQNRLVDCILASPCHIIATMRSKTDYIINENRQVQKIGLAPVQRKDLDYEFTSVLDISQNHLATVSKDRTGLFPDTPFLITPQIGEHLLDWLNADCKKGGEG